MDRGPLGNDIDRFIDAVCDDLADLSHQTGESHRPDVIIEAAALMAAAFDADGRLSDDESWAYVSGIGAISEPPLIGTPSELRVSGVLSGKARWVETPSVLFDLLCRADARDGTTRSHRYHDRALRLARACASVDLVSTPAELDHIESFRHTMLQAMDAAGVARPGIGRLPPLTTDSPNSAAVIRPNAATPPKTPAADATDAEPVMPVTDRTASGQPARATDIAVAPTSAEPVLPPARSIGELMSDLDQLVGLHTVKDEIARMTSLLQIQALRKDRGLPTIETSHHLIFTGNPGTGKTTVARLLSGIYRAVGVVSKGQLVETDRSNLVAGFVGQTATKTMTVLESSLGGMLLIDEAYSLARGGADDFGREAIDTLVKFMEDHRDDIGIVAAGYPTEMQEFVDTNPGLKSRFTKTINFADYTDDELIRIFENLGEKNHYALTDDARLKLRAILAATSRDRGFGNARLIRNLFEEAVGRQAQRLASWEEPTDEQLTTLIADDLPPVGAP
ncbi:MAG: AAA family ATPase [Ilumatobacteraceae bacterium]